MSSFDNIPEHAYSEVIQSIFGGQALKEDATSFNFVCPVCGDINRPNKKKAYIYKNSWMYECYKCGEKMHFMSYLKENYPDDYARLLLYVFEHGPSNDTVRKTKPEPVVPVGLPFMEGELVPILDDNPLAVEALSLCKARKIREAVFSKWFVCLSDRKFIRKNPDGTVATDPFTGRALGNEYKNRIIMPFYRFGGSWNQFDARAISKDNPLRYRNFTGVKRTAYNIDFVRFDRPFYILEGTIDSTFIRNSIAIGGIQHLSEVLADNPGIMANIGNCTIIWDNDEPGRDAMIESVKHGFKWFDWDGITEKDVNGAVLAGQMPLDAGGYVSADFIEARSMKPDTASIRFMVKYGNVAKERYIARRNAMNELAGKKRKDVEVLF